jgi:aminoglycoside phosphotransferase (APT) family kinase protein
MARLHRIPVAEARAAGIPQIDAYDRLLGARHVVMPVLAKRCDAAVLSRIETWWAALASDPRMRSGRVAVCHHDLWHDNLLCDGYGRLSGVLDLAHIERSDPAHDFAAPRYFCALFMEQLMSAYRLAGGGFGPDDEHRADRFHEGREFGGLAWAIEHQDEDEINDSIRKIEAGPIVAGKSLGHDGEQRRRTPL